MGDYVLLTDRPFGSDDLERAALSAAGLELRRAPDTAPSTLARLAEGAVGMLICYAQVNEAVIVAAARGGCRILSRYGVGVDNIDVAAASRAGILVTYVPDYCLDEVADHTIALLLAAARGIVSTSLEIRAGEWAVPRTGIHRLQGRRLALVGIGRIGRRVADRARAFGLEVVAYDPYATGDTEGITRAPTLREALAEADFVSLHAPLTDENHHLISEEAITAMDRSPILVNTSRGGLVDLEAVTRALDDGRLSALALDVIEVEPLPTDHPLRHHPRAIVTPHMSFYSAEAQDELQHRAVDEVIRALAGRAPRNPVNADVLAG